MRKFLTGFLIFLLIAAGVAYFLYPTVSDQISQRRDEEVMKAYREKTAAMTAEKKAELFEEARAYNAELESIRIEDVFSGGVPRTTRDYQNRLNVHSGVIGELVIPEISVSLPVYHQSTETPAGKNLVHVDGSSLPSEEEGGNIVLAGPSVLKAEGILGEIGLTDGRMLEDLDRLKPGDLMILNVLDRTMVFRVNEIQTLSAAGLREMDLTPEEGKENLTVISKRTDRRLLVRTERITVHEARMLLEEDDLATFPESWQNVLLLGCPVMLAGLVILWVIERIKRRSYLLPGEGRQSARRQKKAMEKLENIQTDVNEGKEK